MNKISPFHLVLAILITASSTFLLSSHFLQKPTDFVSTENQFSTGQVNGKELKFFEDRIILASQNQDEKERFVLSVDLNRKEIEKGKFIHYYSATLFQNGVAKFTKTNFTSATEEIKKNTFLPTYENAMFDDLSTRESYSFSLVIDDKKIQVDLKNLEGDFITKNKLSYTRYLSAGTGEIKIDEVKTRVNASLEKIYSNDFSEYLFFPGIDDLSSRTYRFLLWDAEGNFYLIDNSTVSKDNPYYSPHMWILYKNAAANSMQKFFEATIDFREKGAEKKWTVTIPGLDSTLALSTTDSTSAVWSNGAVHGTAQTKEGSKPLFGVFSYKKK